MAPTLVVVTTITNRSEQLQSATAKSTAYVTLSAATIILVTATAKPLAKNNIQTETN